ncbi:Protein YTP1 [Madurella mycetomatis]|uniref:Protein YTP1 n=1 Tax=Madurella mycetomatis TaxID=100816 RepID=A0A175W3X9_9PEZI|nr:Protein YTP1 [Madurella mycetomatis]
MKALAASILPIVAGAAVLGLVPAALAHGDKHGHEDMEMSDADKPLPEDQYPPTYFALPDHRAAIYGHIGLMVLGWVFVLPAAVMLSLARSRYTLLVQFGFLALNAGGMLLGVIYNASTPDLYPNNAHHKLGWIVTSVVSAQVVIGLLARVAGMMKRAKSDGRAEERQGFIPVSTEAMAEHEARFSGPYGRFSNDSGQGTEPRTESLRSHSLSSGADSPAISHKYHVDDPDADDDLEAHVPMFSKSTKAHSVVANVASKISDRFWKVLLFAYNSVDRTILILGFIALCTGIIAYGRFFEGNGIFSGLAHWIKGGIFFWLGIFTLGRWAGSFGELGWAWNIRPKRSGQKWRPSAEFIESALIFLYGSTNIFLEHLGNWGSGWSATDLEHVSITVLFIGGGLCGMLVESTRIRDLLNYTVTDAARSGPEHNAYRDEESREELREPETYSFSMNPIPALVILLLGIMMSSHTQESMVSSMVHKQWGNLLTGASFARGFTYVLTWLRPPRSVYPSRPPTELLTAFGLISGGIIFMASSSDTISGMIHYQLDAMFMYTVTMGLVGVLMAWVILLVALKGWAARREARARLR